MSRRVRVEGLLDCQVSVLATYIFGTSTGTLALVAPIQAPWPGARIDRWWIKVGTTSTGDGTLTVFPVVSGGTSSTRQIASAIVASQNQNANTILEGNGWFGGMYQIAPTDVQKVLNLVFTASTTATNAFDLASFGVIWAP